MTHSHKGNAVRWLFLLVATLVFGNLNAMGADSQTGLRFTVSFPAHPVAKQTVGRLFVILSTTNQPDPRFLLGRTGPLAPQALARDITTPASNVVLDAKSFCFPAANLGEIPIGDYFVQALFDSNPDLRLRNATGNLYSKPQKLHLDPAKDTAIALSLTEAVPEEKMPDETELVKFVRLESPRLSKFHGRPIFLRAGIILPRDYGKNGSKRYPLWVRIGGLNTRYNIVRRMMNPQSDFRRIWLGDDTPGFILLQLDGAGPLGDPYYINSANSGPFGDALMEELIPYVEEKFGGTGRRVLSGTSTGGWVSLALQIFHPDSFSGAWSSCPDPVDFRALQKINIYDDDNAYSDKAGAARPSSRDLQGAVTLTVKEEVGVENLLGRNNSYTTSGEQWGEWAAAFSPRGADGLPSPLWDPRTGKINREVAESWKKHDLRLYLEKDWPTLGPKLRGKLHIASGEADDYYLNDAVHLLDEFLSKVKPAADAKIVYGPGQGHGWFDLSLLEMLKEMEKAATTPK